MNDIYLYKILPILNYDGINLITNKKALELIRNNRIFKVRIRGNRALKEITTNKIYLINYLKIYNFYELDNYIVVKDEIGKLLIKEKIVRE